MFNLFTRRNVRKASVQLLEAMLSEGTLPSSGEGATVIHHTVSSISKPELPHRNYMIMVLEVPAV